MAVEDPTESRTVNLGILNCDVNQGPIAKGWGQNDEIYARFFEGVAAKFFPSWQVKVRNYRVCPDSQLPTEDDVKDLDALVLTGSTHDVWEEVDWLPPLFDFIRKYHSEKRFVGLCFGHQAINQALGGTVGTMGYSENGLERVHLNATGRKILQTSKEGFDIHFLHAAHVSSAAPTLKVLGASAKCAVQVTYSPGRVLTVQGHPEFPPEMAYEYVRYAGELFGTDQTANLAGMVAEDGSFRPLDRWWIGAKLLSFCVTGKIVPDLELRE
ncbi:class I glutamine amidotransferase-like protein [Gonapodya prolifera JEL478]|uniref:Class I glutamine amidotransferase-like protein n=1 Tax=Gonapodya prolifera (strain JEL478) TaxID=1344416 RepID=A0A139A650_GONPJ|nr:class I glutamine amidotransferase-like protein [Gonapodya prolifera JEL478]|eukprot:KXS12231.1 class I glutamine amidotransferase-like protein [Gonapodya prolifera JEL478]